MSEDFLPGPVVKAFASDRMRGNDFILVESRLRLDIRKKFVTVKVVRLCSRLSRELWVPSPWSVQVKWDWALSSLV